MEIFKFSKVNLHLNENLINTSFGSLARKTFTTTFNNQSQLFSTVTRIKFFGSYLTVIVLPG